MRGWRRRRRSGCSTYRWRACCPATVGSRRRPTGGSGLPSPGGRRWDGRCGAWHGGWTMAELQPAVMARIRRHVASHAQFPDAATLGALVREGGGVLGQEDLAALPGRVRAELLGAGPLQVLLDTPGVSDVLVNGPHEVWLDRGTGLQRADVTVDDVRGLAVRLAAAGGQRLDDAAPVVDACLPDGTRLHAVLPPVAAGAMLPPATSSANRKGCRRSTRRLISAPPAATGGSTACNRVPSGRHASTTGAASSSRCPPAAAIRTASPRTSDTVTSVSSRPVPRSSHTSCGPFTRTSLTPGVSSSTCSGPAPSSSARTLPGRAARSS